MSVRESVSPKDGLVLVRFQTDPESLGHGSPERLWAKKLPSDHQYFELRNSPFFAKGVSYLDVVEAMEDPNCAGEFDYRRTISPSGHSTYRILLDKKSNAFSIWWEKLAALGCTYEYSDHGEELLYAVDVPTSTDLLVVYKILEDGEKQSVWMFDEGHCGHTTGCEKE